MSDLAHQDYVIKAESLKDIYHAHETGRLAHVFGLEAATMIENEVDRIDVLYGFEALLTRGCILVQTLAPASALRFTSEVLLDISVEPPKLGQVSEQLTSFAGVRFVAATLRGSSLLCEMIQPSQEALFSFLTETLASLDGVRGWQASMELLTIRRGFVETPWWRRELAGHLGSGTPPR